MISGVDHVFWWWLIHLIYGRFQLTFPNLTSLAFWVRDGLYLSWVPKVAKFRLYNFWVRISNRELGETGVIKIISNHFIIVNNGLVDKRERDFEAQTSRTWTAGGYYSLEKGEWCFFDKVSCPLKRGTWPERNRLVLHGSKGSGLKKSLLNFFFFTWLAAHSRISTGNRILRWNPQAVSTCWLCNSATETRDHLFFDYSFSKEV